MKNNRRAYSTGLYIVMALCLAAVMTVGIISLVYDYRGEDFDFSIPQTSLPDFKNNSEAEQVDNNPSGVDPGVSEPEEEQTKYVRPISGEIIKTYSPDELVFSHTMNDYRTHTGIDIAAPLGTEVLAYTDGVVDSVTDHPLMGMTVVISHVGGVKSHYMNLDDDVPDTIIPGAAVKTGDVIGKVGKTSLIESADAAHLHFEITVDGQRIDPAKELEGLE